MLRNRSAQRSAMSLLATILPSSQHLPQRRKTPPTSDLTTTHSTATPPRTRRAAQPNHGQEEDVVTGPRVGIALPIEVPWRLWRASSPAVSTFRKGGKRRPPVT